MRGIDTVLQSSFPFQHPNRRQRRIYLSNQFFRSHFCCTVPHCTVSYRTVLFRTHTVLYHHSI